MQMYYRSLVIGTCLMVSIYFILVKGKIHPCEKMKCETVARNFSISNIGYDDDAVEGATSDKYDIRFTYGDFILLKTNFTTYRNHTIIELDFRGIIKGVSNKNVKNLCLDPNIHCPFLMGDHEFSLNVSTRSKGTLDKLAMAGLKNDLLMTSKIILWGSEKHGKDQECIWCMKGEALVHPPKTSSKKNK